MKYCKRQQKWVEEEGKPPCGKDKECAGASKGFKCGGHGKDAEKREAGAGFKQVNISGVPVWTWVE